MNQITLWTDTMGYDEKLSHQKESGVFHIRMLPLVPDWYPYVDQKIQNLVYRYTKFQLPDRQNKNILMWKMNCQSTFLCSNDN